ncbi:MAG: hypothetical protein Q9166_003915 [cf. Caloplaca sp. 2 TL-2023]
MEQKKTPSHDQAQFPIPGSASDTSASFISRVGASASGLAKETLLRPSSGDLVNELASAVTDPGKGSASSSSAGPSASSMSLQNTMVTHPSSSHDSSSSLAPHSFRSKRPSERDLAAMNDLGAFLSQESHDPSDFGQLEHRWRDVPCIQHEGFDTAVSEGTKGQEPNSDAVDGAAVVAMLSDPSFCVDDELDFAAGNDGVEDGTRYVEKPTERLFQQVSFDLTHPVNSLSLTPNFGSCMEDCHGDKSLDNPSVHAGHNDGAKTHSQTFGHGRDFRVQPWIYILTTYHDEVWGDLLPLVEDARKEASAIRDGNNDHHQHCPAIRRLAMLAGHIGPKADS